MGAKDGRKMGGKWKENGRKMAEKWKEKMGKIYEVKWG
jgi:hypothetical protein